MKFAFFILLSAAFLGGCLSSAPPAPTNWTIAPEAAAVSAAAQPKWGTARLALVTVRAPYDGQKLAVLRKNGSLAFDSFNLFAAAPAALLRGAARDVAARSGLFARVVPAASAAAAPYALEVSVTRLALDCRTEGVRNAVCELSLTLLNGREIVGVASGEGTSSVHNGDFSAAFSTAFTTALSGALKNL